MQEFATLTLNSKTINKLHYVYIKHRKRWNVLLRCQNISLHNWSSGSYLDASGNRERICFHYWVTGRIQNQRIWENEHESTSIQRHVGELRLVQVFLNLRTRTKNLVRRCLFGKVEDLYQSNDPLTSPPCGTPWDSVDEATTFWNRVRKS